MGTSIQKVIRKLPKDRQQKIKARANEYILEYETLAELRKELGITQEMIAKQQGVNQVNISNIEKRNDMLISTLHRYVRSIGGKLEIHILLQPGKVVRVRNLQKRS